MPLRKRIGRPGVSQQRICQPAIDALESRVLLSSVLVRYDFAGSPGDQASTPAAYVDPTMTASPVTRGPGLTATTSSSWTDCMTSNSWTTSPGSDLNDYYSFGVWTIRQGLKLSLDYLYYTDQSDTSGPHKSILRSSQDGFTTNIGNGVIGPAVDHSVNLAAMGDRFANLTGSIEFRLYAYSALNSSTGKCRIMNNAAVNGLGVTGTISSGNLPPSDIVLSPSSIPENQVSGTKVGMLSTTGSDPGDPYTYTLVSGTGSEGNTSFGIVGNELVSNIVFNYEANPTYSVRVGAHDQLGLFYIEKSFTIQVININEPPSIGSFAREVHCSGALGFTVADFANSFTDPDIGDTLQYIRITNMPAHGSLSLSGVPLVPNQEIPAAQLDTLCYTSVAGYTGPDGFMWTGSDGSLFAPVPAVVNLNINFAWLSGSTLELHGGLNSELATHGSSRVYTVTRDGSTVQFPSATVLGIHLVPGDGTNRIVVDGTLAVPVTVAAGTGDADVSVTRGTVLLPDARRFGRVTIGAGGKVESQAGAGAVLLAQDISIASDGVLDLAGADLIVNYAGGSPLQTIQRYVRNGDVGSGEMIRSIVAGSTAATTIGLVDNHLIRQTVWGGVAISDGTNFNQIILKRSLRGDANLDGKVDQADYLNILANMGRAGAQWFDGDLNHDGTVTADDFALVSEMLSAGGHPAAGPSLTASAPVAVHRLARKPIAKTMTRSTHPKKSAPRHKQTAPRKGT